MTDRAVQIREASQDVLSVEHIKKAIAGKSDLWTDGYETGVAFAKQLMQSGGGGAMFNHIFDDNLEELSKMPVDDANMLLSQAETQLKETVTKAAEETLKARGTIPSHLESIIKSMSQSTVSWLALLRNAVVNAIRTSKKRSMRRPNRRSFGTPGGFHFPGNERLRADSCSASRLFTPDARPYSRPFTRAATVKSLRWSGPSSSIVR